MRIVLQRIRWARVKSRGKETVQAGPGLLALVGFASGDEQLPATRAWKVMQEKILNLRIFPDEQKLMNLSLTDTKGELLLVPQFTLYADCKKGRRPGFSDSAAPDVAEKLFELFSRQVRESWIRAQTGYFGAEMDVEFCNWGPVTILLDSRDYG